MKRCLLIVAAVHLTLVLLVVGVFASAGSWLRVSDELISSDIIVVLAGAPERAAYAADIFQQGYAPLVLVSRPAREQGQTILSQAGVYLPSGEEAYSRILMYKGVPVSNIKVFGTGSLSTLEEAIAIRDEIIGSQPRVIVVTSPFHVRRSRIIFGNVLKDKVRELRVVGNPYESFPAKWWTNQDAARNVMLEVIKLVYFQLGGAFLSYAR